MRGAVRGFSLLEVVVAIGVFALGIIVVIGLFAPLARSVGANADAEAATNIADVIKAELMQRVRRAQSFAPVAAILKDAEALDREATTDSRGDAQLLFASRDGSKIGEYGAAVWNGTDREKFFEITLSRNGAFSPPGDDGKAAVLVFTARIRWPALVADGPVGQQTLFINGALSR